MNKMVSKKGFTLIELLIVITIIGILAAALLPSILGAPARARDASRKADMNNILTAIETYNNDYQIYPATPFCVSSNAAGDTPDLTIYFQGGETPQDPQGIRGQMAFADCYGYYYCPAPVGDATSNYLVFAKMEVNGSGNTSLGDIGPPYAAPDTCPTPANVIVTEGGSHFIVVK